MRNLEMLIGAFLLIMILAGAMFGLNAFRSREYIEPHVVITGPGVDGYTTGSVILSLDLYDGDIGWVTIVSDKAGDAAVPLSYTATTRELIIGGLVENSTRQLDITYRYNQLDSYWGSDLISKILPVLLIFAIIGFIGVAVYGIWPRGGGG